MTHHQPCLSLHRADHTDLQRFGRHVGIVRFQLAVVFHQEVHVVITSVELLINDFVLFSEDFSRRDLYDLGDFFLGHVNPPLFNCEVY